MKRLATLALLQALLCLASVPGEVLGEDLVVSTALQLTTPATYDNVIVQSTGILTVDAPLTVLGNMTILSGGKVTHSVRLLAGLRLDVVGTLDVQSGGSIDVGAKGLLGGYGAQAVDSMEHGETYHPVTGVILRRTSDVDGGSHGGKGGGSYVPPYGLIYDNEMYPTLLGSGGGAGVDASTMDGGNGGGLVRVTAGTLQLGGTINCNGGSGPTTTSGGGGSGGSVLLEVGTFSGAGSLTANGGTSGNGTGSGGGGGGRVAVLYDVKSFTGSISARGGSRYGTNTSTYAGSAGTIYQKDNAVTYGDLVFDNAGVTGVIRYTDVTLLSTLGARTFRTLTVRNLGSLVVDAGASPVTVEQPVMVTGTGSLTVATGGTLAVTNATGFDVNVESSSTLTLQTGSTLAADLVRVSGGTLSTYIDLSYPTGTDFELSSAGVVNVLNSRTFAVGSFDGNNMKGGTFNLPAGSVLDVASDAITVASGVTLVKDGTFGAVDEIGSLTILSGGVVTHSVRLLAGLRLKVAGELLVGSGGVINIDGKGLYGGEGGKADGDPLLYGETYNPVTGVIERHIYEVAGGSHGGKGGGPTYVAPYGLIYGSEAAPVQLGSGGGAGNGSTAMDGGAGGGVVIINAEELELNGVITADGNTGPTTTSGGGGSGGSVLLEVGTFSGAGSLTANGGTSGNGTGSGGGGGGRVAVLYDVKSFTGSISARGGSRYGTNTSTYAGSAGTIYQKDNAVTYGDLVFDNAGVTGVIRYTDVTLLSTLGARTFRTLTVRNLGSLVVDAGASPVTVEQPVMVTGTATLTVATGGTLAVTNATGFDVNVESSSTLTLQTGSTLAADLVRVNAATLSLGTSLVDAGKIVHLESGTVASTDTLRIEAGGAIEGIGTINKSVVNSGRLGCGSATGMLTISGSYRQASVGTMGVDLSSATPAATHKHLTVSGSAELAGALAVNLLDGFVPPQYQPYQVLACASLAGGFSHLSGVDASYAPSYTATAAYVTRGDFPAEPVRTVFVDPPDTLWNCLSETEVAFGFEQTGAADTIRGYEIKFAVDPAVVTVASPALDVVEGSYLRSVGSTAFYAVSSGGGNYTVSCAILGGDLGAVGNGELFTVKLTPVAQGSSAITITSVKLRDLDNDELGGESENGAIRLDCTPPTMEPLAEAQNAWYNAPPVFANFGFDDDLNLDQAWYRIDGGDWAAVFGAIDAVAWDADGWALPGFAGLADGVHQVFFRVRDDAGNWNGEGGTQPALYSWKFRKDATAPQPPTGFAALPGNNKTHLSWIVPAADTTFAAVEIRFNRWNDYPEYGTPGLPAPSYPADHTQGTFVARVDSVRYDDVPRTPRDIYYYAAFAMDSAGNYSTLGATAKDRTTSYWLGDVDANGAVNVIDLVIFSNVFWLSSDQPGWRSDCDFGPTDDWSAIGIPLPDNRVDFEDLMVFSINYGTVLPAGIDMRAAERAAEDLDDLVKLSIVPAGGGAFSVTMENRSATLKGVRVVLDVEGEVLRIGRGDLLSGVSDVFFEAAPAAGGGAEICLAALGSGVALPSRRSGEIARFTVRETGGPVTARFEAIDLRDLDNARTEIVSLERYEAPFVPRTTALMQNYPNPFNPSTTIDFDVAAAGRVTIRIFDVAGRLVATPVDARLPVGRHHVQWNGRNGGGAVMPSGVYFCRMSAAGFEATKKMMLLR